MKKFKIGQTVYYYYESESIGHIITCRIKGASKDLATGEITYVVTRLNDYDWLADRRLTADYLYRSEKQIHKEHKDELAYAFLSTRLHNVENALDKIMQLYAEKIEANPSSYVRLGADNLDKSCLYVEGIGNVQEEFNKLKKDVENLKKKIKKPTKKTVKGENYKEN